MRDQMIKALLAHANGEIERHKTNVTIFLENPVGVGDHPDIMETIQSEIDAIAKYEDQIQVINKYFSPRSKEFLTN